MMGCAVNSCGGVYMAEPKKETLSPDGLLKLAASSGFVALLEFRMQERDPLKWVDKETKTAKVLDKLTVAAEFADTGKPVSIEVMPERGSVEGAQVEPWPYKRGDLILVTVRGVLEEKGKLSVRAKDHQLFLAK